MWKVKLKFFFQAWCSVQSVFLFLSVVFIIVLIVKKTELSSVELAVWVQAIGAIISIWAAWWIANQQGKRDQIERRRGDIAKCAAVLGLLEHVVRVVKFESSDDSKYINCHELRNCLEKTLAMLDNVDILSLPDQVAVRAVLSVRHAIEMFDLKIKDYQAFSNGRLNRIHYDFGFSRSCLEVLVRQIELCGELVRPSS